jgi:hypothetical protein
VDDNHTQPLWLQIGLPVSAAAHEFMCRKGGLVELHQSNVPWIDTRDIIQGQPPLAWCMHGTGIIMLPATIWYTVITITKMVNRHSLSQ